jgi:hypothetical protein
MLPRKTGGQAENQEGRDCPAEPAPAELHDLTVRRAQEESRGGPLLRARRVSLNGARAALQERAEDGAGQERLEEALADGSRVVLRYNTETVELWNGS